MSVAGFSLETAMMRIFFFWMMLLISSCFYFSM